MTPNSGIKSKHPEEKDEFDADKQEIKRLKLDRKEIETETVKQESSWHEESETPESSRDTCGQVNSGTACNTSAVSEDCGKRKDISGQDEQQDAQVFVNIIIIVFFFLLS